MCDVQAIRSGPSRRNVVLCFCVCVCMCMCAKFDWYKIKSLLRIFRTRAYTQSEFHSKQFAPGIHCACEIHRNQTSKKKKEKIYILTPPRSSKLNGIVGQDTFCLCMNVCMSVRMNENPRSIVAIKNGDAFIISYMSKQ